MKIVLLELMPFPYTVGGGTTHIMNLGKALTDLGNEVHVISSKPGRDYKKLRDCSKNLIIHNVGIKHKKFEGSGKTYYIYRLFFELFFILGALKEILKIRPEIIDSQSPITTALPASFSKYPFIITCHGIHSEGFNKLYSSKGKNFVAKFLNVIYIKITEYNIKKSKKIVSQGKSTLNYYLNIIKDKNRGDIIPNLVDTTYWKTSKKRNNNLIITVARLTKQKALDKLILAMKDLKEYKLLIIGEGEMKDELKKLAGSNVNFLGYKKPEECKNLYATARFHVLPSEFEGLPYSILESMSCKVIPITTKVGDLQSLIKNGKNGFLLENNKPETIVEIVNKASKKKMNKIADEARKTIVNHYGAKKVAQKFLKIYLEEFNKSL